VIEPLGESKTDFQVFTELAYRLEALDPTLKDFGKRYNPRADRSYFQNRRGGRGLPGRTGGTRCKKHQGVTMSWEEFKKHGVYKFKLRRSRMSPSATRSKKGVPFETASGKIEIFSTTWPASRLDQDPVRLRDPGHPEVDRALRIPGPPEAKKFPFHLITPHPRWRTHSIFNNIPGCAKPTSRRSRSTPAMPPSWASRPATRSRSGTIAASAWCRSMSPSAACPAWWCCSKARGWTSTRMAWTAPATPIS
jgi:anaerobic selenocysteine-containing dehydrogenase